LDNSYNYIKQDQTWTLLHNKRKISVTGLKNLEYVNISWNYCQAFFGKLIANRQLDPMEEMSKVLELIQNMKRAFVEEEMKKGNSSLMH
jgi:hypothetical protein